MAFQTVIKDLPTPINDRIALVNGRLINYQVTRSTPTRPLFWFKNIFYLGI
jgi:hypothetical protein